MIKFFQHISLRQNSHSIQYAFRFKAVLSGRKQGSFCDTKYFDDDQTSDTALTPGNTPDPAQLSIPGPESQTLPRPMPRPTGKSKNRDNRSNTDFGNIPQDPAPASTTGLMLSNDPAPALTTSRPRPAPRPKGKGKRKVPSRGSGTGIQENLQAPALAPAPAPAPATATATASAHYGMLTLDPAYAIDPPIILDKSLEPSFDGERHSSDSLIVPWSTVPTTLSIPATD